MHLLAALSAIEQVGLNVLKDREQHAARLVSSAVAVGASDTLGEGGYTQTIRTLYPESQTCTLTARNGGEGSNDCKLGEGHGCGW